MIARLASVVGIFFLSAAPVFGQGAVSEFNGSAVDQSGGALPGVTVTVTEETTGLVRTVVSNEVGRFVIPALTPGRYTLRAELSGFQTQTRAGVQIGVGQSLTINFTLPVGTLQDQVTVTGESPLVEVTQTEIGTNMTANDIENMPLQGREQYALLQLVPGLTPSLQSGSFEGAVSPLDADGMAIRNGIDGESKGLLDLRVQYIVTLRAQQTLGFFLELYNATNAVNFVNPTGNRRSADFLVPVTADDPRSAQLGFRYTF